MRYGDVPGAPRSIGVNLSIGRGRASRPASLLLGVFAGASVLALTLIVAPGSTLADGPVRGRLIVPGDHFQPGETVAILGVDLDENHDVILRLASGARVVELGSATVGPDRSLVASATIPADFPRGYAELSATVPGGSIWSTQILVGDRAEAPGADSGAGIDTRAVALALAAIGILVFVIASAWYIRARSSEPSSPNAMGE